MHDYWGKAGSDPGRPFYHLLVYHSLDVAAVGGRLLDVHSRLLSRISEMLGMDASHARNWLTYLLALHDLGKFSEPFQHLRPDIAARLRTPKTLQPYSVRHDALGFALWRNVIARHAPLFPILQAVGSEPSRGAAYALHPLIQSVTGHHGRPPATQAANNADISIPSYFSKMAQEAAIGFCAEAAALLLPTTVHGKLPGRERPARHASWLLAGLCTLADWIGSDAEFFRYESKPMPLETYWRDFALPRADFALQASGIGPSLVSEPMGVRGLFPVIEVPRPVQRIVETHYLAGGPQLFIIEDLTGSGKTEAALTLAHRMMAGGLADGVFCGLPTMATANAMYGRFAESYRRLFQSEAAPSLALAHSARALHCGFRDSVLRASGAEAHTYDGQEQTAGAMCTAWIAEGRKKALLADVGVGTLDQALLAVLPAKHQSLRLLGLMSKVLIVDEVHSYDPYMNVLLVNLLRFHAACGGSAILLSATLPLERRAALVAAYAEGLCVNAPPPIAMDYPLLTHLHGGGLTETEVPEPAECTSESVRDVVVESSPDMQDVLHRIVSAAQSGRCVCWVRNTVADALNGYHALCERMAPLKPTLFHARFALGDRLSIEGEVLSAFGRNSTPDQRRGRVLVATQVVEQSLDLDFDLMVTDLAPIDLVMQRAGRLHRHDRGERGPAVLIVHGPSAVPDAQRDWYARVFRGAAHVYPFHGALWRTMALLEARRGWKLPDDSRRLIEGVYGANAAAVPEPLALRDSHAEQERRADRSLAGLNALKWEQGYQITADQWLEDTATPTRLGELDTLVRLARWDGTVLRAWSDSTWQPWAHSEIRVARRWIATAAKPPSGSALAGAMDAAQQAMPDQGRWSVLLPVNEVDGHWEGKALDPQGRTVLVRYDPVTGLAMRRADAQAP